MSVGRVSGSLSGAGPEAKPARADVAFDYRIDGRGRAVATVALVAPYGFTSRSDVPELQWEASAVVEAGFEAWCAPVAQSINGGLPEELTRIRGAADPKDHVAEPVDAAQHTTVNLDPWVDVTWLRSPLGVLRHVFRQAKASALPS